MKIKAGILRFLDVVAYVIIPAATIFFPWGTPLLETNFSAVTWGRAQQFDFFAWGTTVGLYCAICLGLVLRTMKGRAIPSTMLVLAAYLLVQGLVLPYLPVDIPWYASLHVTFNFLACALLVLAVITILLRLARGNWRPYGLCLAMLGVMLAGIAGLFLWAGIITSALEIWFVLSVTLLVHRMMRTRMREVG